MLRSVWVLLAVAATACAAPVWDGSSGSVRITQDPGAGKIAVRDSELSVTAENPQNVNKYLFFEIKCKPFSLKNKALSLEVRTAPESRGSSFYVFCYNAPLLIVVANRADYGNNLADCACAIENMMLAANALDPGSNRRSHVLQP